MAFFTCNFHADTLGKACMMNVIVPQKATSQIGMGSSGDGRAQYPVLYLLHGLSDDQSIWMRRTSIERYVAELPLIVVMPNGDRSFYNDMPCGMRYFTFLTEELPRLVEKFFSAATGRENRFIAGLSMGGYGALKAALRRPDLYSFAAGLSSVADVADFAENFGNRLESQAIFGDLSKIRGSDMDLFALAEQAAASGKPLPKLLQICGTEDFLYRKNQALKAHFEKLGKFDYSYFEAPGSHSWAFWDEHIQRVLKALPI